MFFFDFGIITTQGKYKIMQTNQKVKSIKAPVDTFSINLVVSNNCNYSCRYCPTILHDNSIISPTTQDYIAFFENLINNNPIIYSDFKKRTIQISGGEPTRYEGIEELCAYLRSKDFFIIITSNGSAKMEKWEIFLPNVNSLVLSFHPRYCNYKHFADVLNLCRSKKVWCSISLIMDPEYWDRALEAEQYFKEKDVLIQYKALLPWIGSEVTVSYTPEQKEFLSQNTIRNNRNTTTMDLIDTDTQEVISERFDSQKIFRNNLHKFKGYKCEAGRNNLSIDVRGNVEGATCGMASFGNMHKDKNLIVKLNENGVVCEKESCICISDLLINKQINETTANIN